MGQKAVADILRDVRGYMLTTSKKMKEDAQANLEGKLQIPVTSLNGRAGVTRKAYDTGELANTLKLATYFKGHTYEIKLWSDLDYAWYIHEGFKSYPPNPFLSAALSVNADKLIRWMRSRRFVINVYPS